eukprot:4410604-Amphidinium_carterae.1
MICGKQATVATATLRYQHIFLAVHVGYAHHCRAQPFVEIYQGGGLQCLHRALYQKHALLFGPFCFRSKFSLCGPRDLYVVRRTPIFCRRKRGAAMEPLLAEGTNLVLSMAPLNAMLMGLTALISASYGFSIKLEWCWEERHWDVAIEKRAACKWAIGPDRMDSCKATQPATEVETGWLTTEEVVPVAGVCEYCELQEFWEDGQEETNHSGQKVGYFDFKLVAGLWPLLWACRAFHSAIQTIRRRKGWGSKQENLMQK